MAVQAVVFDIGGVLEITPPTGMTGKWEHVLGLGPGELARHREQARYGFEDITDLIIYSHEVGTSKPDPRIYELTCERLGVRPEEMIFLDDVPLFTEAAQRAGLQAILFTDNAQAIADIDARLRP
jgi:beta-phosphoglucomutase-like phosphatase (HAD superfamily)